MYFKALLMHPVQFQITLSRGVSQHPKRVCWSLIKGASYSVVASQQGAQYPPSRFPHCTRSHHSAIILIWWHWRGRKPAATAAPNKECRVDNVTVASGVTKDFFWFDDLVLASKNITLSKCKSFSYGEVTRKVYLSKNERILQYYCNLEAHAISRLFKVFVGAVTHGHVWRTLVIREWEKG